MLDITISIDSFSEMNNADLDRYIENVFKLIYLQYTVFNEKDVHIRFSLPENNQREAWKHFKKMMKVINPAIDKLVEE
jgi:hypothetical protein